MPRIYSSKSSLCLSIHLVLSSLEFNLRERRFEFLLKYFISSQDAVWHGSGVNLYQDHRSVLWCFSGTPHQSLLTLTNPDRWRSQLIWFLCDSLQGDWWESHHISWKCWTITFSPGAAGSVWSLKREAGDQIDICHYCDLLSLPSWWCIVFYLCTALHSLHSSGDAACLHWGLLNLNPRLNAFILPVLLLSDLYGSWTWMNMN